MAKIELDNIASGYNLSKVNANFQKIEDELNNKVLYRDVVEGEPNQLEVDVDMNGNRILNLPNPSLLQEPVTLGFLDSFYANAEAAAQQAEDALAAVLAAISGGVPINTTELVTEKFSGNASQTVFTITEPIVSAGSVLVFISGVFQSSPADFTVAGQVVTFTSAPPSGTDNITVVAVKAVTVSVVADASVSTAKIQDGAVVTAKIADNAVTNAKLADNAVNTVELVDNAVTSAKIVNNAVTTAKIADAQVTLAKLAADVIAQLGVESVPIGTIAARMDNQVPTNWVAMNNQELEIAQYGTLYGYLDAAITLSLTNGAGGAGTSHFRVPDVRGYFFRGAGTNADTLAIGAVLGTKVQDTFKAHTHTFTHENTSAFTGAGIAGGQLVAAHTTTTSSTGDAETAPKHITVNYVIKAK
jgi:microcystin-dependent protein